MSFLTTLTLVSLAIPGIATVINVVLLNLIYLDVLETDKWLLPLIYNENEPTNLDIPLNSYFDDNGFSSLYYTKNIGSTLVFLAGYVVIIFAILLLKSFG